MKYFFLLFKFSLCYLQVCIFLLSFFCFSLSILYVYLCIIFHYFVSVYLCLFLLLCVNSLPVPFFVLQWYQMQNEEWHLAWKQFFPRKGFCFWVTITRLGCFILKKLSSIQSNGTDCSVLIRMSSVFVNQSMRRNWRVNMQTLFHPLAHPWHAPGTPTAFLNN